MNNASGLATVAGAFRSSPCNYVRVLDGFFSDNRSHIGASGRSVIAEDPFSLGIATNTEIFLYSTVDTVALF